MDGATDTTVTLSWMTSLQSNGVIIRYDVQYRRVGTSPFITQSFTGLTGTITELTANTTYHIGVAAATIVGNGPFSTFLSQKTSTLYAQLKDMIISSIQILILHRWSSYYCCCYGIVST